MQCLTQVLAKYGAQGLALSKFVGTVCRLLEDPNPQVGGAAIGWAGAVSEVDSWNACVQYLAPSAHNISLP